MTRTADVAFDTTDLLRAACHVRSQQNLPCLAGTFFQLIFLNILPCCVTSKVSGKCAVSFFTFVPLYKDLFKCNFLCNKTHNTLKPGDFFYFFISASLMKSSDAKFK